MSRFQQIVFCMLVVPVVALAANVPGPAIVVQPETMCGFESRDEVSAFFEAAKWSAVEFVADHAVEGSKCAKVTPHDEHSEFKCYFEKDGRLDLTGFDSLRVWVYNDSAERVRLSFSVKSGNGITSPFTSTFLGAKRGRWLEVTIEKLKWRRLDITDITRIMIGASGKQIIPNDEITLYIDSLQRVKRHYPAVELRSDIATNGDTYLDALLNSPTLMIEETARKLAANGSAKEAGILFAGMANPKALYPCTDALLTMNVDWIMPAVTDAIDSEHAATRMMACCILRSTKSRNGISLLLKGLTDSDLYVRHFAAESLCTVNVTGCEKQLIAALSDEYPMVRLNAAKALGRLQGDDVVVALSEAIGDPAAGINAIRALGTIGDEKAVTALCGALSIPDLSMDAAAALDAIGSDKAVSPITFTLDAMVNSRKWTGKAACGTALAAGLLDCKDAGENLRTLYHVSTDAEVRHFAIQAIGQLRGDDQAVRAALEDFSPLVRMAAVRAYAAIHPDDKSTLQNLRYHEDASITYVVDAILGQKSVAEPAPQNDALRYSMPEAIEIETIGPMTVFSRRSDMPVGYDAAITATDSIESFSITAAGDEYESLQVSILAGEDLQNVRCDLLIQGKPVAFKQYVLNDTGAKKFVQPGNSFDDIPADTCGTFWFTIYVPQGLQGTEHKGEVIVTSDEHYSSTPVTLKVLPFTLPRLDEPMHVLYTGELGNLKNEDKAIALKQINTIYDDMASHGMNCISPFPGARYSEKEDGITDTASYEQALQIAKTHGLDYKSGLFMIGALASSNKRKWTSTAVEYRDYKHPKRVQRLIYAMKQRTGEAGLYIVDEPGMGDENQDGPARNRIAQQLYRAGKELPGAYLGMTSSHKGFDEPGPQIDLWCFGAPAEIGQSEQAMKLGKRLTNYGHVKSDASTEMGFRCKFGLFPWRSGQYGQTIWTYGNKMAAEIMPESISPYTDWEAVREGVDDLRYLKLYEQLVRKNAGKGYSPVRFLGTLNSALHPERGHESWSAIDPAKAREAVIKEITMLLGE